MDTENARVTRKEAALLAGVTERTINRWAERGLVRVTRPAGPWGTAQYDREDVLRVALRDGATLALPEPPEEPDAA